MKKLILLLFICLLCLISYQVEAGELPESERSSMERFLKADGKVLRNNYGKGDIVTLRGTNIGGWQVMEAWMCPTNGVDQLTTLQVFTERFGKETTEELIKVYEDHWWQEEDFNNITELGFNVIRLPISYINLLDENGSLREDTLSIYDWFVSECEKRGIYVILDLHCAPGSQNGKDHSGDSSGSKLYSDRRYQEMTISLWEQLAAHYNGNPTIAGYDLLNEPEGRDEEKSPWGKIQLPFYDELYKAVRAIDKEHLIILESVWEATDMPDPSEYGWENVMYQYHFYGWDGIEDASKQKKFIDTKVLLDEKTNYNVPVLVGEFTFFTNLSSWLYGLSIFEERGWSYTTWTYKTVEYGNWGIYSSKKSDTPDVDIYKDEIHIIKEKWSKIDTKSSFSRNPYLADLLTIMADEEARNNNQREWFHNFTTDAKMYRDVGVKAELVDGSEVTHGMGNEKILKFEIAEDFTTVSGTKNLKLLPMIRQSIDTTDMDYLLLDTFVRNSIKSFQITLVDKEGNTWTSNTFLDVPPITHKWERLMVDISEATIDRSSVVGIFIGAKATGSYYFKDIYFAQSYGDEKPTKTLEEMKKENSIALDDSKFSEIFKDAAGVVKSEAGKSTFFGKLSTKVKLICFGGLIGSILLIGFLTIKKIWAKK